MDKRILSEKGKALFEDLSELRKELDTYTLDRFERINPFSENLCDWNRKGERFGGESTVIYDSATLIGTVEIGSHCWVGLNTLLDGSGGGLTLGDYVVVASGVHIYTHDTIEWALSGGMEPYRHAPVHIGSNVFIGAQSVVTCGVNIGDHCVVCANATVTRSVEPYSIVGGTPARVIGRVRLDDGHVELEYF